MKTMPYKLMIAMTLTVLAGFDAGVRADDIAVEGLEYKNVRLMGLDGQTLKVLISGRQQTVDLARLTKLDLDDVPQLAQAQQAMAKNQPDQAATLLAAAQRVLPARKQFLKPYILALYVRALDAAGKFDPAVQGYLSLAMSHPQPFFLDSAPKNIPDDQAIRKQTLQRIEFVVRSTRNERAQQALGALTKAIRSGQAKSDDNNDSTNGDNGAEPVPTQVQVDSSKFAASIKGLQQTIVSGEYDKALELIEKYFDMADAPVEPLTFLRAQAQAGKGQHMDAAIGFLRVAILWPESPNVVPALIGAGSSLKAAGDTRSARTVWTEAKQKAPDASTRTQIDRLLQSISAE